MILYSSEVLGVPSNCVYPHAFSVRSAEELRGAVSHDYVCAKYRDSRRSVSAFQFSDCVSMDMDNDHSDREEDWIRPEDIGRLFPDVTHAIHFSRNHMKPKGERSPRPRFHVLFAINPCTDAEIYKAMKEYLHALCPFFDGNALDAARFMFGTENPEVIWVDGSKTLDQLLKEREAEKAQADLPVPGEKIRQGSRNRTLSVFAGKLLKRMGNSPETVARFRERAAQCDPPLPESELSTIWNSACRFYEKIRRASGYVPPEQYSGEGSLRPKYLTELDEANLLASEYGDYLRYSDATQFLVYQNGVWLENNELAYLLLHKLTERQLAEMASSLILAKANAADAEHQVRKAMTAGELPETVMDSLNRRRTSTKDSLKEEMDYYRFLLACRGNAKASAVLNLTKALVQINVTDLDRYPYLLNTPGGEVDLRTGELLPHDPLHYHTHMTAVTPSRENMDLWLRHVDEVTCGDRELARYFQLTSGESLYGAVRNEYLQIEVGSGSNGKSTYTNTKLRVMGTYGGQISSESLTLQNRFVKNWEIGELRGKRLIVAGELEEGQRLNGAFVKKLCSTDSIIGEKKRKDPFTFLPSHSVVLYTNHLPKVWSRDHGTWRRLKVIPFNARLSGTGRFRNYTDFLYEHCGGAVLQWMIDGAKDVIADEFHIEEPDCVRQAIEEYRRENDWLSHFLEDCCDADPSLMCRSGELYQRYREYAAVNGEHPRGPQDFANALEQLGYERHRVREGVIIRGLAIRSEFADG